MKTIKAPVVNEATVTATKTTKPVTATKAKTVTRRVSTSMSKKADIKPEAKKTIDTKNLKDTIKTAVVSQREVKWKYPEDISEPLTRKSWRAEQRRKLTRMEAAVTTAKDEKSKKASEKELLNYRKEVLLVP